MIHEQKATKETKPISATGTAVLCFFLHRLARGAIEIFPDAIENSVYECAGLGAAKSFGELDRFVDRNDWWNVIAIKHLVDGEAQDISIDRGNAVEIIILAVAFDLFVNVRQVRHHSFD